MIYPRIKQFAAAFCAASAIAIASLSGGAAHAAPAPSDLEHQEVSVTTADGLTLSGFVSRAVGRDGPAPALFLTQWVSCGSIAPRPDRLSEAEHLALASNYALIRVDRAGEGSSEGPGCDQLDYNTEVQHYREAIDQLADHPWIDRDQIVIFGSSLGSTTAPLVAQGKDVAGVIIQGAGALTYYERMVHFDRIQLEREPEFKPEAIDAEMRRRIEFHQHYLHGKMTPTQIEREHPHLAGVWQSLRGTDAAPHYGRPFAWHWQAAEQNWMGAWAQLDAPVMVVFGEYEQFESRHGHRAIVDSINRLRPGTASWLEVPQAGHGMAIYPDQFAAYLFSEGDRQHELFFEPVAAWLRGLANP